MGGKLVVLNSMPPRWSCVCPKGAKRRQTGKNAYVCTGFPGGSHSDPTKDCLKKGWKWTRKGCVEPNGRCPKGFDWQAAQVHQAAAAGCPKGYVGKPPNCTKSTHKPCPKGSIGRPPNCTKTAVKPPNDRLKDVKKAFKNLKDRKKN